MTLVVFCGTRPGLVVGAVGTTARWTRLIVTKARFRHEARRQVGVIAVDPGVEHGDRHTAARNAEGLDRIGSDQRRTFGPRHVGHAIDVHPQHVGVGVQHRDRFGVGPTTKTRKPAITVLQGELAAREARER